VHIYKVSITTSNQANSVDLFTTTKLHNTMQMIPGGRDNAVGTLIKRRARQVRKRASIPGRGKKFISSPELPENLWCSPSILFIQ